MTYRIIIPDDFPRAISGTKAEEKLKTLGETKIFLDKAKTQEELIERIKKAEVVINIRAYTHLNAEVLALCRNLRLISIWGSGTDNVDVESARKLGIPATNTPGTTHLSV